MQVLFLAGGVFEKKETKSVIRVNSSISGKVCEEEVSFSAIGLGTELGWTDSLRVPIICFSKEGVETASSLDVVSKESFPFTSAEDMIETLSRVRKGF